MAPLHVSAPARLADETPRYVRYRSRPDDPIHVEPLNSVRCAAHRGAGVCMELFPGGVGPGHTGGRRRSSDSRFTLFAVSPGGDGLCSSRVFAMRKEPGSPTTDPWVALDDR